jgi:hypothetical protein
MVSHLAGAKELQEARVLLERARDRQASLRDSSQRTSPKDAFKHAYELLMSARDEGNVEAMYLLAEMLGELLSNCVLNCVCVCVCLYICSPRC